MSSFLPFYSPLPEATPVYKYIYMYTTLENVYKSLLKNISNTPSLFVHFLPLSFSRVLCCSIVMSTLLSLNGAFFLLYLCCHRISRTSTCCIVHLHCRYVLLPFTFTYVCLSCEKKKLLRNNCFSFFYFLVENCTYVGCLLLVHLKDNAVFLHVYDMIP